MGLEGEIEIVTRDRAVIGHHLVHEALLLLVRVFVGEDGEEPVAFAPHGEEPEIGGHHHFALVQVAHVGGAVEHAHVLAHQAVGADELDPRAVPCQDFRAGDAGGMAAVVVDEDALARRGRGRV